VQDVFTLQRLGKPKASSPNNPDHSPTSPSSHTSVEPVSTPSAAKSSNVSSISSSPDGGAAPVTTLDSLEGLTPKGSASRSVFFSPLMIFQESNIHQDQEHLLTSSTVPSTSPPIAALSPRPLFHESTINNKLTLLRSPIALSPTSKVLTTDNLAPASAAPHKTIAPAANDYTPPASPEPETETTTPATTTKNLQSAKNVKLSKSKLNAKLAALPPDVKKSTEPR
jgi:hypothetical protein